MNRSLVRSRSLAVLIILAAGAACKDSTAPAAPASIAVADSVIAEGTAGLVLPVPPSFVVNDESGKALGGVPVSIAVTAGGGTLTGAPTSSKGGPTPVGTWKLGDIAGINSLTVTVGSLTPFVISVNGKAGPPATLVFTSGQSQSAPAGTAVRSSPVVQVRDQFGNGVAGVSVSFLVVEGDGSVSNFPVPTDVTGSVTAPVWTLGKSLGPQTLRASTAGNIASTLSATIETAFNIDLRIFGPPMPPGTDVLFAAAAARISGAVTGDVPDFIPASPLNIAGSCGVPELPSAFSEPIDDLLIFASIGPIDGERGVLAFAGPCVIRGQFGAVNRQSLVGVMKFDSDDIGSLISAGTLTDVIQHEMLHVVGIGTLWGIYGVIQGAGTSATRFTGTLGFNACISLGGAPVCQGSVPLENQGGPGTADGHWRELVFRTELMTGFVTGRAPGFVGVVNPFSTMSIQSLADIGYAVNTGASDSFTVPPPPSSSSILGQLNVNQAAPWERVIVPHTAVDAHGRMTIIPQQ